METDGQHGLQTSLLKADETATQENDKQEEDDQRKRKSIMSKRESQ